MKEEILSLQVSEWAEWIDRYSEPLLNRAFYLLSDREEAKDLVQEVFLDAYTQRLKFKGDSSPLTWLMAILYHKAADWYKEQARLPFDRLPSSEEFDVDGEWLASEGGGHWPQESDSTEHLLDNIDFREIFYLCLDHLPAPWKMVVKMSYLENVQTTEICQSLQLTPSNFWKILQRSRLQLRSCLEKHWFEK